MALLLLCRQKIGLKTPQIAVMLFNLRLSFIEMSHLRRIGNNDLIDTFQTRFCRAQKQRNLQVFIAIFQLLRSHEDLKILQFL